MGDSRHSTVVLRGYTIGTLYIPIESKREGPSRAQQVSSESAPGVRRRRSTLHVSHDRNVYGRISAQSKLEGVAVGVLIMIQYQGRPQPQQFFSGPARPVACCRFQSVKTLVKTLEAVS